MTISGSVEFTWCGVNLVLLPDRALFLPRSETLLVADVHLGKPASFRARGVPVPEAVTAGDLDRLSCLLDRLTPRRVIVLGPENRKQVDVELSGTSERIPALGSRLLGYAMFG